MKFTKLFMAIAIVCLAVACGCNNKSEEAKAALVDPQEQIEIATKAVEEEKWVDAAEAIAKIDPAYISQEHKTKSAAAEDVAIILLAITLSEDKEAINIIEKWGEKLDLGSGKLETE